MQKPDTLTLEADMFEELKTQEVVYRELTGLWAKFRAGTDFLNRKLARGARAGAEIARFKAVVLEPMDLAYKCLSEANRQRFDKEVGI